MPTLSPKDIEKINKNRTAINGRVYTDSRNITYIGLNNILVESSTILDLENPVYSLNSLLFIEGEIPTGTINGINNIFIIDNIPILNSLRVYLNGQRLTKNIDYTYTNKTLTLTTIPYPEDILRVDYTYNN